MTATSLPDVYAEMLSCAYAQKEAIDTEDWNACQALDLRRSQLLRSSEEALLGIKIAEPAHELLAAIMMADEEAIRLLEAKKTSLLDEMGRFQHMVVASTAYRGNQPDYLPGHVHDSRG